MSSRRKKNERVKHSSNAKSYLQPQSFEVTDNKTTSIKHAEDWRLYLRGEEGGVEADLRGSVCYKDG